MIWVGLLIVVGTFALIIKNYETRMVLFLSGALMAILGGDLVVAANAFIKQFTNSGLVPIVCTVMGFSYVIRSTKCSEHLVAVVTGLLNHVKFFVVPGAVVVTFFLNISLPSAAGVSAAVGTLLIPMLLALRVKPVMAGSAVFLGTWGSVISPGFMFNPLIADMAKTDVMTVIANLAPAVLVALCVAVLILTATSFILKEGVGSSPLSLQKALPEGFKVNPLYAIVPIIPLLLLVLGSKQVGILPYISVPQSMIVGVVLAIVVTRSSPGQTTKEFFRGAGDSFCEVIGLMACAAMFCAGMEQIGLTSALLDAMKNSTSATQIAATAGPFLMSVVSGSGNAASLAFIGSVVPHAPDFGYSITELGGVAQVSAALGRTMSPVAASAIICARLAGVNPMSMAKRNALPTIAAAITVSLLLL